MYNLLSGDGSPDKRVFDSVTRLAYILMERKR